MRSKLKPCPFCGHTPEIVDSMDVLKNEDGSRINIPIHRIECKNKECKVNPFTEWKIQMFLAEEDWNKRDTHKGKWNADSKIDRFVCSECGNLMLYHTNFCHNCGADMRGD